jgi:hypothetical protein
VAHEVTDHLEDGEYLTVTKDTYDFLVEVNKSGIRPFSTKTKLPKGGDEIQVIQATQVIDHRIKSERKKEKKGKKGGNGGVCDPTLGIPEQSGEPIEIERISKHTVTKTKQGLVIDKNSANIVININETQTNGKSITEIDTTKLANKFIQSSQQSTKLAPKNTTTTKPVPSKDAAKSKNNKLRSSTQPTPKPDPASQPNLKNNTNTQTQVKEKNKFQ